MAKQVCGAWEPNVGGDLTPDECQNARPCERHDVPPPTPTEAKVSEATWLIYFEDVDHRPEVFGGAVNAEAGARARLIDARWAWSCHLFVDAGTYDAQAAELRRARAGIRKLLQYAEHLPGCRKAKPPYAGECDCGLLTATKGLTT